MTVRSSEVSKRAHLNLPDGRGLDFEIRSSAKARSLRLRISIREGLVVTAPVGVERSRVIKLVASKSPWIVERLSQLDAVRHLVEHVSPVRPQAIELPALAESWRIEYRATRGRTVGARTERPGRIVVSGRIDDVGTCQAALRRWLARRAKDALVPWLTNVAQQMGLRFAAVNVKNQRTRWASCTLQGRVSLNCKLLFLPREQVRYVMVHELCHTVEHNHSNRFWAHLRMFEPKADVLHGKMRDAWKLVPLWAQRGSLVL